MLSPDSKTKVQSAGRFLSKMVMSNIGAFIAWGLISALFSVNGWLPNSALAGLIDPMLTYLIPVLIGYTGGRMTGGERGAVVGAIMTFGLVAGSDIPMLMGAMLCGPIGGLAIKKFDDVITGKVKTGFEMLVNNFSAGIVGMLGAILAYLFIGPFIQLVSSILSSGVELLVETGALALVSIIVEPAKILFLNNAINHGIFSPIGIDQVKESGQSIIFLIESNPGPGLGVLLAYMLLGKGTVKQTAGGASIIHFFGGIQETYFPYILINPRLFIAVIIGGMTGVFTLTLFESGLVSAASPGSIISILLMTPKASMLGVILSIVSATMASFAVACLIIAAQNSKEALTNKTTKANKPLSLDNLKTVYIACDTGVDSSAMGATLLRKKFDKEGIDLEVESVSIDELDKDALLVISHEENIAQAKQRARNAHHIELTNYLDRAVYDALIDELLKLKISAERKPQGYQLAFNYDNIFLGQRAANKEEAIRYVGEKLATLGNVTDAYIDGMIEREKLASTYLGESIALPHGTIGTKQHVLNTGVVFCQFRDGVDWDEEGKDTARIVIGIAAKDNEHIKVITSITTALDDPEIIERLKHTNNPDDVIRCLNAPTTAV